MSSTPLRRVRSRALRAASRAIAASTTLASTALASPGRSSNHWPSFSATTVSTAGRTSDDTSFSLVCEENLGSGTLIESTAVRPSRASSPVSVTFSRLASPVETAKLLIVRVSAARKPARCVPPSPWRMLLVKHSMVS